MKPTSKKDEQEIIKRLDHIIQIFADIRNARQITSVPNYPSNMAGFTLCPICNDWFIGQHQCTRNYNNPT